MSASYLTKLKAEMEGQLGLFSIANLTREVRDELRISNAKKANEDNCAES